MYILANTSPPSQITNDFTDGEPVRQSIDAMHQPYDTARYFYCRQLKQIQSTCNQQPQSVTEKIGALQWRDARLTVSSLPMKLPILQLQQLQQQQQQQHTTYYICIDVLSVNHFLRRCNRSNRCLTKRRPVQFQTPFMYLFVLFIVYLKI
jgi:hypothetical protein